MYKKYEINNKVYECIFSLGAECYCAELLSHAKLRAFSSPFDWLCGAPFKERVEMICNNFQDFLNQEDLKKTGEREFPENCDIYFNNKNKIYFNHDFPKGKILNESYPTVKNKYDKRINRLCDKLKNSKNSLIVYMSLEEAPLTQKNLDEIILSTKNLNEKFGKTSIDILYVKHNIKMKDNECEFKKISENAYVAELYNKTRDDNGYGNYNNCKKLLSQIKLRKKFSEMLLKISKGRKRIRVYLFGVKIMSFNINN